MGVGEDAIQEGTVTRCVLGVWVKLKKLDGATKEHRAGGW